MARFSTELFALFTEKPTGTSTAFQPDYLYLTKFPRVWSGPVVGFGLRAPTGGGTVALALLSDDKGQPNEVLFKTELPVPSGKDSNGYSTLVTTFPEPVENQTIVWIGFRFSQQVQVPLRLDAFVGKRTAATVDFAQISGSLRNAALEDLLNDQKLGLPIVFPIFGEEYQGVSHGE
ncbi:MAG TPA: hypothetical protein VFX59_30365 [Polyangiales bacterium]|nr:hypothetical protein [Polyangiales bacterium]